MAKSLGTIASLEHALGSLDERLREREADLKQFHRQSEDRTKQVGHPFDHEEKLSAASNRQQEIVTALDITKNQASAKLDEGSEQSTESVEKPADQAARKKPAKITSATAMNPI